MVQVFITMCTARLEPFLAISSSSSSFFSMKMSVTSLKIRIAKLSLTNLMSFVWCDKNISITMRALQTALKITWLERIWSKETRLFKMERLIERTNEAVIHPRISLARSS